MAWCRLAFAYNMGHAQHGYKTATFYSKLIVQLQHTVFHYIDRFNMPMIESFVWIDNSITVAWAGFWVTKILEKICCSSNSWLFIWLSLRHILWFRFIYNSFNKKKNHTNTEWMGSSVTSMQYVDIHLPKWTFRHGDNPNASAELKKNFSKFVCNNTPGIGITVHLDR